MAQRSSAPAPLTEDLDSVLSIHMVTHKHLQLQFQGPERLFSLHSPQVYTYMQSNTLIQIKYIKIKKNKFRKKKLVIAKQPVFCRGELYLVLDSLCLSLLPDQ